MSHYSFGHGEGCACAHKFCPCGVWLSLDSAADPVNACRQRSRGATRTTLGPPGILEPPCGTQDSSASLHSRAAFRYIPSELGPPGMGGVEVKHRRRGLEGA